MSAPYVRAQLLAQGYTAVFSPEQWEDIGGPENGPHLVGHVAYTTLSKGDHAVYFDGDVYLDDERLQPDYDHDCAPF